MTNRVMIRPIALAPLGEAAGSILERMSAHKSRGVILRVVRLLNTTALSLLLLWKQVVLKIHLSVS